MKPLSKILISLAAGVLIGGMGVWLAIGGGTGSPEGAGAKKEPLYWVAPMDPNYRRDKPGKSPMGMDLIPVYEEGAAGEQAGAVTVSPDVVNNLGVRTAPVTRGRLDMTVNTVGYVQYDEDHLIHIHPRVEGWIEKLYVKAAGDPVEQHQPLYALYSPTLVNAEEELLLAQKRGNPELIAAAVERLSALQVPESEINRLKKSGRVSQTVTIKAPQSGVVDNLNAREGMFVKPGMEMMSIGQLEHIWVIGEVFERQAASVHEGDPVRMRLDYLPGRQWQGRVDYIYPSLNPKTRTAQVRVHFDNPDRYLRPGMFAQMAIETAPSEQALLIPREALIRTGSQARVVLALGEGRFKSIEVKVGRVGDSQVQILSGLEEGDRIVTSAQFLIDSESSKTSDFRRMAHGEELGMQMDEDEKPETVSVAARVEKLMPEDRMVTLAHEAIESWDWPPMVMDFVVDDAVDFNRLRAGMDVHVAIRQGDDGRYYLTEVHILDREGSQDAQTNSGDNTPRMDMSQEGMDMGTQGTGEEDMNHGDMDHDQHQQGAAQ